MGELANLPALTADELDVLGAALLGLMAVGTDAMRQEECDAVSRKWWAEQVLTAHSLATAVHEARYSLDRGDDG